VSLKRHEPIQFLIVVQPDQTQFVHRLDVMNLTKRGILDA
jgi:hypothetical protein